MLSTYNVVWEAVTAISGSIAAITAVLVGLLSIRASKRTIDRQNKDHLSKRADAMTDRLAELSTHVSDMDSELLPFWPGNPERSQALYAPVHRMLNRTRSVCEVLDLTFEGLYRSQPQPVVKNRTEFKQALRALEATVYIQLLHFTSDNPVDNRIGLRRMYERELEDYGKAVTEMVLKDLRSINESSAVENTVVQVTLSARKRLGSEASEALNLVYEYAARAEK